MFRNMPTPKTSKSARQHVVQSAEACLRGAKFSRETDHARLSRTPGAQNMQLLV